jgi:hypothetical protein
LGQDDGTGLAFSMDIMSPRALVTAVIGAACIAAAGVGGFLALRANSPAAPSSSSSVSAPLPATVAEPAGSTVAAGPPAAEGLTPVVPKPPSMNAATPVEASDRDRREPAGTIRNPTAERTPARPVPVESAPPSPAAVSTVPSAPAPVFDPVVMPTAPPEPPAPPVASARPVFEELTIKTDSVIGIRLDSAISSDTARVEDKVIARVSRDVDVDGRTAIPEGARLEGTVTLVDKGGRFRERARLEVRFHSLVLGDTTRITIQTDRIFRDGESPTNDATSKIGASAVIGSILGAVIGGKKGAAIGGSVGAAGGTAAVAAGGTNAAVMAAGSPYTVRLTSPVAVLVERDQDPR